MWRNCWLKPLRENGMAADGSPILSRLAGALAAATSANAGDFAAVLLQPPRPKGSGDS